MQVEILKFLLDASAHLQDARRNKDADHLDDLQAVDRALPDCDWFELVDDLEVDRRPDGEFWQDRRTELEF